MDSTSIWYIVAGLLMLAEAFTPRLFIFICLAVSSLVIGIIDQLSTMNFYVLILIFIATTAILAFTLRPALKFIVKIPENKNSDNNLIGKEAMVFKPITETELGTIKLFDFDAVLLAKSLKGEFIGQGTTVKIIQKEGDIAIVECL
ncbi:MAG: NfeD family protein [Cyanobacteria bacterium REEB446]|nr:NfeD family protein [Cyanobacteria bacterium REEB446]